LTEGPREPSKPPTTEAASRGQRTGHSTGDRTVETIAAAVARHVRRLRSARNWSLDELAGRSGVSKGMVVQIEAARTNPSVGTLSRIAEAFGVSITDLLEAPPAPEITVFPTDRQPVLWAGEHGGSGRLLGGVSRPGNVELWDWILEPGEGHTSTGHAPHTREILHIVSGVVTVTMDGTDHQVRRGETVTFLADRPHGYRNDGPDSARITMVVVMPLEEHDRRRS